MKSNRNLTVSNSAFVLIERAIRRNYLMILACLSTASVVVLNTLPSSAQSANGFGEAVNKVKSNTIINAGGAAAADLVTFPFVIAGTILLLVVLLAVVVGVSALLSGRDWATPFLNMVGLVSLILMGAGILGWVATSGLFG